MRSSLSSSHHLHHIHILYTEVVVRRCSSKLVFLKLLQISQEHTWVGVFFLIKFFYRTTPVAASIDVAFHECFFFDFSLAALPVLPYSTVTFFVWRNTFVFMSLLLYMINIIIAEWFIRITANTTIYCTAISMIVKRISALMQLMLKQTKKTYK